MLSGLQRQERAAQVERDAAAAAAKRRPPGRTLTMSGFSTQKRSGMAKGRWSTRFVYKVAARSYIKEHSQPTFSV